MRISFDEFVIDTALFELRRAGGPVAIEPKALQFLILLAENRDRVIGRDELFETVWSNVIVTDASVSTALAQVRRALGDDGQQQKYVKTVRGKGFRLVANVVDTDGRSFDKATAIADRDTGVMEAPTPQLPMPPGKPDTTIPDSQPVLAVLPFALLGAGEQYRAIAEAIPAELISTISKLRWLRVIARGSSFRFPSAECDASELLSTLGAHYVLTGSVELAGKSLIVFVELTDTRTCQIVWSDRFSAPVDQVFDIREKIARDVVSVMELHVPLHEALRLAHQPSEFLDAWGHYHLGVRYMYRYNKKDNSVAEQHFQDAIRIDPDFARAHAGLAYTEFTNYFQKFGKKSLDLHRAQSLQHAQTALSIDPLDPLCNLMLGRAQWLFQKAEAGLEYVDRAIELNSNYAFAYYNSAILNTVICNGEGADKHIETALMLSPLDPNLQSMWGTRALAAVVRNDLSAAVNYINKALGAPYPHLYVFVIAAVVFQQSGATELAKANVEHIRNSGVDFGKQDFLAHYNFRDPEPRAVLVDTLATLGL